MSASSAFVPFLAEAENVELMRCCSYGVYHECKALG